MSGPESAPQRVYHEYCAPPVGALFDWLPVSPGDDVVILRRHQVMSYVRVACAGRCSSATPGAEGFVQNFQLSCARPPANPQLDELMQTLEQAEPARSRWRLRDDLLRSNVDATPLWLNRSPRGEVRLPSGRGTTRARMWFSSPARIGPRRIVSACNGLGSKAF